MGCTHRKASRWLRWRTFEGSSWWRPRRRPTDTRCSSLRGVRRGAGCTPPRGAGSARCRGTPNTTPQTCRWQDTSNKSHLHFIGHSKASVLRHVVSGWTYLGWNKDLKWTIGYFYLGTQHNSLRDKSHLHNGSITTHVISTFQLLDCRTIKCHIHISNMQMAQNVRK